MEAVFYFLNISLTHVCVLPYNPLHSSNTRNVLEENLRLESIFQTKKATGTALPGQTIAYLVFSSSLMIAMSIFFVDLVANIEPEVEYFYTELIVH